MNYIICFWDKSKIQVNQIIGEKLKEAIKNESIKNFELGSSLYSIGGIEKIITKEEAFTSFPTEWEYLKEMEDRAPSEETLKQIKGTSEYNPKQLKV